MKNFMKYFKKFAFNCFQGLQILLKLYNRAVHKLLPLVFTKIYFKELEK